MGPHRGVSFIPNKNISIGAPVQTDIRDELRQKEEFEAWQRGIEQRKAELKKERKAREKGGGLLRKMLGRKAKGPGYVHGQVAKIETHEAVTAAVLRQQA